MEKTTETTEEKGQNKDTFVVYEVSYLLLPFLDNNQVEQNVAELKSLVDVQGGVMISDENPVLIDLAYSITKIVGVERHKSTTGYFGWMKFELSQEVIEKIKKSLDASETIMRYLIVKTVRENTLLTGKMNLRKEEKTRKDDFDSEALSTDVVENSESVSDTERDVATPEEIDKSIDDLVIA